MELLRTVGFGSGGFKSELAGLNLKVFGSKDCKTRSIYNRRNMLLNMLNILLNFSSNSQQLCNVRKLISTIWKNFHQKL